MKVAMLGWEFPPFMAGGLGIHCLEITQRMAAMGVEIDFYMPRMPALVGGLRVADHHAHLRIKEVEAQPELSPYGGRGGKADYDRDFNAAVALYNQRLVAEFDSHDADVIHCHDWITVHAALELRERTGLPLVFSVHSLEHDRSAGFMPQQWIEDIERAGVRGADRVIGVSAYTKELLVKLYGVDPHKVTPVHNGVDLAKFPDGAARDHASPGPVLFLSRISRQKGPLFFLEAARRVIQVRPDATFIMAGKGEMLRECIDYCVRHGIADRVRFAGFVAEADLATIYAQCGVYVLPSVSEPFGISILEAMGSGLPTIISKTTGVGEALGHALKADFWDTDEMADMILRLLADQGLREELGRNGAREARRFTWEACARKTIDVYRDATRTPRPPRPRRARPQPIVATTLSPSASPSIKVSA